MCLKARAKTTYILKCLRLESCGTFLRRVLYPAGPFSGGSFIRWILYPAGPFSPHHLEVLQDKFYPELSQLTFNDPELYPYWFFMQDGARPHSLNAARQFLSLKFETRTIGDRLNTPWPARSPDLTPCDFFLWGG